MVAVVGDLPGPPHERCLCALAAAELAACACACIRLHAFAQRLLEEERCAVAEFGRGQALRRPLAGLVGKELRGQHEALLQGVPPTFVPAPAHLPLGASVLLVGAPPVILAWHEGPSGCISGSSPLTAGSSEAGIEQCWRLPLVELAVAWPCVAALGNRAFVCDALGGPVQVLDVHTGEQLGALEEEVPRRQHTRALVGFSTLADLRHRSGFLLAHAAGAGSLHVWDALALCHLARLPSAVALDVVAQPPPTASMCAAAFLPSGEVLAMDVSAGGAPNAGEHGGEATSLRCRFRASKAADTATGVYAFGARPEAGAGPHAWSFRLLTTFEEAPARLFRIGPGGEVMLLHVLEELDGAWQLIALGSDLDSFLVTFACDEETDATRLESWRLEDVGPRRLAECVLPAAAHEVDLMPLSGRLVAVTIGRPAPPAGWERELEAEEPPRAVAFGVRDVGSLQEALRYESWPGAAPSLPCLARLAHGFELRGCF
mmetsp:Transcript_139471/g.389052  ORF Transcript_139471/g.389052 Transcript_139471/m.389052 type:complete len:488 (+) Transcript_139471:50-1513(+)